MINQRGHTFHRMSHIFNIRLSVVGIILLPLILLPLMVSAQPLLQGITKKTIPNSPGFIDDSGTSVVRATDSVPIEVQFKGISELGEAGIYIVFIIDNSGSMDTTDSSKNRYKAIKALIEQYKPTRDNLDRISIITYNDTVSLEQTWKNWSQTENTIEDLMASSPSGGTNMEDAMRKAISLLENTPSFYKLGIILSDGDPVPDNDTHPQTLNILREVVPLAFQKRILFSTIYTSPPTYPDKALLIDIARRTDYITDDNVSYFPKFYHRVYQSSDIISAYNDILITFLSRLVPLDVKFKETINSRLFIDPGIPIGFSGDGVNSTKNIIDGNLDDSYETFRNDKHFYTNLNELDGTATLGFSVKLDLSTVTDQEINQGYVLVKVNDESITNSYIKYLKPAGNTVTEMTLPLPQTTIKFTLGCDCNKILNQDEKKINIVCTNLSAGPELVQLVEYPSSFVDISDIQDDFGFKPFEMLFENRIIPWFRQQAFPGIIPILSEHKRNILNKITQSLKHTYYLLLNNTNLLDDLLCQISFYEDLSGTINDYSHFWNTKSQRGIFKISKDIPKHESRKLSFNFSDASSLIGDRPDEYLTAHIDAVKDKNSRTMSNYKSRLVPMRVLQPNPLYSQLVTKTPSPDLFIRNCFESRGISALDALFKGRALQNAWNYLDSEDIRITMTLGATSSTKAVVSIDLYNCGQIKGDGTVKATSIFLPFTGKEISPPYTVASPFISKGTCSVSVNPSVDPSIIQRYNISYDKFYALDSTTVSNLRNDSDRQITAEPLNEDFLKSIKNALVVTVVEITGVTGEKVLINNKAIEIVELKKP